jgi:hypothetical protein
VDTVREHMKVEGEYIKRILEQWEEAEAGQQR